MVNATYPSEFPPLPSYTLRPVPRLLGAISDEHLVLIISPIVYWTVGLFFHWINVNGYWAKWAIHTPAEFLKRNRVSQADAIKNVLTQQFLQIALGAVFSSGSVGDFTGHEDYEVAKWALKLRKAQRMIPSLLSIAGVDSFGLAKKVAGAHPIIAGALAGGRYSGLTQIVPSSTGSSVVAQAFANWEISIATMIYYYLVPACQFAVVILFSDAWQYFWHRFMHQNKWMYSESGCLSILKDPHIHTELPARPHSQVSPSSICSILFCRALQSSGRDHHRRRPRDQSCTHGLWSDHQANDVFPGWVNHEEPRRSLWLFFTLRSIPVPHFA